MKTRNGFVSNSSSSSFVVAFPKKPKTGADIWKYMFDWKEGSISCYDGNPLSFSQISEMIFEDLSHNKFKKASLKDIISEFDSRYYHTNSSNVFWMGKTTDEHGGSWSYEVGRYFGSNKKVLERLRLNIVKHENFEKEIRQEESVIVAKLGKPVRYAYEGGTNYSTKKPFTKKEISEWEKYSKRLEEFKETDKEYLALSNKRSKLWKDQSYTNDALYKELAREDAQNFLDDNKGKFIFTISYSDNDGEVMCTMEHGDIFRNVPHVRISHH